MADAKISALTELAQGAVADTDETVIVDKSDTTDAASGTTKRWTWASLKADILAYIDDATATFTNKTFNLTSNTLVTTKAQLSSAVSDGDVLFVGDVAALTDGDKGDVTVSASGATWTIDNSAVTLAKQADMATASLVYRKTAGSGAPEVNTLATLKTDLGLTGTNSGDQTTIVGITGTKAQFDTAVSDGNIMFDGDSITNATSTAWRVFYGDGSGVITELALGADGTFLKSNGAGVAPSFATPAGSGDVSKVGTPVNNQMGVWTGDGTLEGTSDFTYDGTNLNLITGKNLQIAGETIIADAAGTKTLSNIDALDATTESTIESAIDTLANLTSVQGLTVGFADAGADAIYGWDDSANTYENLTQGEVRAVAGLATTDSPEFAGVNIGHATDTTLTRVSAGLAAIEGNEVVLANRTATRTMVLTAAGGFPSTTAGCASNAKSETTTNDVNYYSLDFDQSTEENAEWTVVMPDSYSGGTITAIFYWTAASGSGDVIWGIKGRAYAEGDALDQAFGTAVTVTDTLTTANDVHISSASSAVTLGGSPAGGQLVALKIYRDADAGGDTLSADAKLLMVKVEYPINSYTD